MKPTTDVIYYNPLYANSNIQPKLYNIIWFIVDNNKFVDPLTNQIYISWNIYTLNPIQPTIKEH